MAVYDYKAGKKRIDEILSNELEVVEKNKLPSEDAFTFDNGYYSWITGVFIDIRDSSSIFANEDKEKVSKIVRCFTSEIIEILRNDENLREIGIRGDCVYAIYTTPTQEDIFEIVNKSFYVNTYLNMLNKILKDNKFDEIKAGIGISTAQELVVKAGRKGVGINNKVWIGDAVTKASNLSSLGDKNSIKRLVLSSCTYSNIIDQLVSSSGEGAKEWFKYHYDSNYGTYYDSNIIISDFNSWIEQGMPE
ncbi:MAG: adenylate/guanylate cyclase domain-containing protein [Paraclostridium sp.]